MSRYSIHWRVRVVRDDGRAAFLQRSMTCADAGEAKAAAVHLEAEVHRGEFRIDVLDSGRRNAYVHALDVGRWDTAHALLPTKVYPVGWEADLAVDADRWRLIAAVGALMREAAAKGVLKRAAGRNLGRRIRSAFLAR